MGCVIDSSGIVHGYVRTRRASVTVFDVPGAGAAGFGQGTTPQAINSGGEITGQFVDVGNVNHGFVRAPKGAITTFDVSGAGTSAGQGTIPLTNN